jgi:hypothetical protein
MNTYKIKIKNLKEFKIVSQNFLSLVMFINNKFNNEDIIYIKKINQ